MLTSIQVVSHVGTDGLLSLEVPQGFSNLDVLVTVQPLASAAPIETADTSDWKSFLAETYGACADLDFEEPDDPPPQQREWS